MKSTLHVLNLSNADNHVSIASAVGLKIVRYKPILIMGELGGVIKLRLRHCMF